MSRSSPQPRDIYDETKLEAEGLVASAGNSTRPAQACGCRDAFPSPPS